MDVLRHNPPKVISGVTVTPPVIDRQSRIDPVYGEILGATDFVARNMLIFRLQNGARVIIRPSGTEPKSKVYVEVSSTTLGFEMSVESLERIKSATDAVAQAIADDFINQIFRIIGVELPAYALRISGLVPLDRRIAFVREFIPSLEALVRMPETAANSAGGIVEWIDKSLRSYGEDARGLVSGAVAAYVADEWSKAVNTSVEARVERLRSLRAIGSLFGMAGIPC
jgi:hypothetical protein